MLQEAQFEGSYILDNLKRDFKNLYKKEDT